MNACKIFNFLPCTYSKHELDKTGKTAYILIEKLSTKVLLSIKARASVTDIRSSGLLQ